MRDDLAVASAEPPDVLLQNVLIDFEFHRSPISIPVVTTLGVRGKINAPPTLATRESTQRQEKAGQPMMKRVDFLTFKIEPNTLPVVRFLAIPEATGCQSGGLFFSAPMNMRPFIFAVNSSITQM
jgi:hypothetical protein